MINELLRAMSEEMKIYSFQNEPDESFIYRLCYSALGQWCLSLGENKDGTKIGTTKHNQTFVLNELLVRFGNLFPATAELFVDTSKQPVNLAVAIRRAYEETGYLITDENNHNILANYGRSLKLDNISLFFGLPKEIKGINGLGVFAEPTEYEVTPAEFLIRDSLSYEQYFNTQFDPIDFYERDISLHELEIFNPLSHNSPSQSWEKTMTTDCSVARRSEIGPFYRVLNSSRGAIFADETTVAQTDDFTSFDYRRLYFAMKRHYGNPIRVWVTRLDANYSKIRLEGHLPNREYYLMLLLSWPERSAFDKSSFIISNCLLKETLVVLENIGFEVKGGY